MCTFALGTVETYSKNSLCYFEWFNTIYIIDIAGEELVGFCTGIHVVSSKQCQWYAITNISKIQNLNKSQLFP